MGLEQDKVFPIRCSVGAHMTVKTPAFAAVAIDYVHQHAMDFEPDRSAEASARCEGSRLLGRSIHSCLPKSGFTSSTKVSRGYIIAHRHSEPNGYSNDPARRI